MTELVLVVGLGNPGDRYNGTRHNVGFDVVDAFAKRTAAAAGSSPVRLDRLDCRALTGRVRVEGTPVLLAKPQTYMNVSGESVKGLAAKYDVPFSRMMIVNDDVSLPVGRVRIKASGSSAGQKGLQNIIDCFRTDAFPRLRVGVAGEDFRPGADLADYVLSRFSKSERPLVQAAIDESCEALEVWMKDGLDAAMNRFNRSPENSLAN